MPHASAPSPRAAPSVPQFLSSARRRRWLSAVAGLALLIVLILADRQGWLLHEAGDWRRYEGGSFRVVYVVDGDTLDIDAADGDRPTTRVRLWGVDTPETAKPREGKPAQPFADEAEAYTRRVSQGQVVRLTLQAHEVRDRYHRLLAYVELPDGSLLNERLLSEGLARHDPRFPHEKMSRYELIERQARVEKRGMWGALK